MQNEIDHIQQEKWHKLIPQKYRAPAAFLTLTKQQTTILIESQKVPSCEALFNEEQMQGIREEIEKSTEKCLFPKINGRGPMDLQGHICKTIEKPEKLLEVITTSEYVLEKMEKGEQTKVILRHYDPGLSKGENCYEVVVQEGYVLAVGQKFCDHIEEPPSQEVVTEIITAMQDILPIISTVSSHQPKNSFVASVYCYKPENGPVTCKITSVKKEKNPPIIFDKEELQVYADGIEGHKSEDERYFYNEGVVPLVKTVRKKEDMKSVDLRDYYVGNELDSAEKVEEWKEFMKEANEKISK